MRRTDWIAADWPAPAPVQAGVTTRLDGFSKPPYESFNLAAHVGDDPDAVRRNRQLLCESLILPGEPVWLDQAHGQRVLGAHDPDAKAADAAWTDRAGIVCAVLTADCLPLLLCDENGTCVAAVHVGWRGLVAGVVAAAVARLPAPAESLLAWLGPAIGPSAFEVGTEVRDACLDRLADGEDCFRAARPGHWFADLPRLTQRALQQVGVSRTYASELCTFSDPQRFYSYRRDGQTGRMASLIWMDTADLD